MAAMRIALVLLALVGLALPVQADFACPGEPTNFTFHTQAASVYIVGAEAWQEANGMPGLQRGGACGPDAQLL